MKLEVTRKDFIKSWSLAERFVDTKSPKEAIKGILISTTADGQATLTATDLKTSVKCKAEGVNVIEPGTAVIPVAIFGSMIRKADADELSIDINTERGFLKAGKNKMKFGIISAEHFPNIPESSESEKICEVSAELLSQLIAEGGSASSVPQEFPKYIGACLLRTQTGMLKIVATDGKRLSLSQRNCEAISIDKDLMLPAVALKELGKSLSGYKDKNVHVSADESTAFFVVDDVAFSVRLLDALFPLYERILNDVVQTSLKVRSGDLILALDRIDIIAKTTPAHVMVMTLNPNGEIKITARAPEAGIASEEFLAEIGGSNMTVGFNVGYFLEGLKILGENNINIEFSGEESQARMKREGSDDFLYMVMPTRLSPQDKIAEEEMQ